MARRPWIECNDVSFTSIVEEIIVELESVKIGAYSCEREISENVAIIQVMSLIYNMLIN